MFQEFAYRLLDVTQAFAALFCKDHGGAENILTQSISQCFLPKFPASLPDEKQAVVMDNVSWQVAESRCGANVWLKRLSQEGIGRIGRYRRFDLKHYSFFGHAQFFIACISELCGFGGVCILYLSLLTTRQSSMLRSDGYRRCHTPTTEKSWRPRYGVVCWSQDVTSESGLLLFECDHFWAMPSGASIQIEMLTRLTPVYLQYTRVSSQLSSCIQIFVSFTLTLKGCWW